VYNNHPWDSKIGRCSKVNAKGVVTHS
jgi:hypothetical protein